MALRCFRSLGLSLESLLVLFSREHCAPEEWPRCSPYLPPDKDGG